MKDIYEVRLAAAEKAYQEFEFARDFWPSSAGEWSAIGSNFTRTVSIVYDAEEDYYREGEFGVSFPADQAIPDQLWSTLGRLDISRDGTSVKKCDRRGYLIPTDLFDSRVDVAEQAYLDFEFADSLLPCDQGDWIDDDNGRLRRAISISGGEEEDDRVGEFQVVFNAESVSIVNTSASLGGKDIAYRPRRGRSPARPW